MDVKEALEKAEQFLKAARVTLAAEMNDTCAIACYYAVFWAAIAMLHYCGVKQRRWKHGEVKEKFGMECVKRRRLCPEEFGRWIRELYELRNDAMYEPEPIANKVATRATRKAEQFSQHAKEVCRR